MLTEIDIDRIKENVNNHEETTLFYVAHTSELHDYSGNKYNHKSKGDFAVLEVHCKDIYNALFLSQDLDEPTITDMDMMYLNRTTKIHKSYYMYDITEGNTKSIPGIISGACEYTDGVYYRKDPIITPVFTNVLSFKGQPSTYDQVMWKYRRLDMKVDDIHYEYFTSDWWVLKIDDVPGEEYPLVNTKDRNAFFMNVNDAFDYKEDLES